MAAFTTPGEPTALATTARRGLYVRWSLGPARDVSGMSSTGDLTGVPMPGLSSSPLDVEAWRGNRPTATGPPAAR
ncbi:DUF6098 family protein [Streptomyces sediminimaris]|uniref:DUF6098 family protein n=1 Tax=Streptomyces sediminimaris TaxID=3383721 RepID=UPI003999A372